ncbi:MAG: hypothetical protein ACHQAY_08805, partial [Hyphomicrobiales bacterium]
ELVPGYRSKFRRRRDLAAERLSEIAGMSCRRCDAGFYLFPHIAGDDIGDAELDEALDRIGRLGIVA